MSEVNQGGFYYVMHGKKLHPYGFVDKQKVEDEIASLADDVVVEWNSHRFDDKGNVFYKAHVATPEEEGDDGTGDTGVQAPDAREDPTA